jgi:subtilisin-like proprotein convertase family protein
VKLEHTYIGDLRITLIPPAARGLPSVVLHNRSGGPTHDLDRQYDPSNTPGLAAYAGKRCDGTWTVRVEDMAAQDSGMLIQIGLQLALPAAAPDRVASSASSARMKRASMNADKRTSAASSAKMKRPVPAMKNGKPRAQKAMAGKL